MHSVFTCVGMCVEHLKENITKERISMVLHWDVGFIAFHVGMLKIKCIYKFKPDCSFASKSYE